VHGTIESTCRVEWRGLAELGSIAAQWRELAARVLEPNVFYEPPFVSAAAPAFGKDVGAHLVWSRAGPPRLLGFFPARVERRRYGILLPVLVGWTHPYAPLGSPLVDREAADAVLQAWLDHLAEEPQFPKLVLLPYLPAEGELSAAFDGALARRGGKSALFGRHARALLAPGEARDTYLVRALDGKKRKELRRQRKRMHELGTVTSVTASTAAALGPALDDFLALEASGWKGRARTAANCDDRIASFMQEALTALAREGKAQVMQLRRDAEPIAALIILRSGDTAWCWKIAYDEAYGRFSPGVQLVLDATDMLLRDHAIARADSCATPDHPMIDHVWRERLMVADRLLCLDAQGSRAFALARALEEVRRAAIRGAKAARDMARRR